MAGFAVTLHGRIWVTPEGLVSVEGKGQLWYTTKCHLWDAPKENVGFAKTQCSSLLLKHPFFFHQ
jgi:hypothetical protein